MERNTWDLSSVNCTFEGKKANRLAFLALTFTGSNRNKGRRGIILYSRLVSQRDKSDALGQNCAFIVFRIRLSYLGIIVCAFPSKTFNTNVSLSTIPIQAGCPWPSQSVRSLRCAPCQSNGVRWHFSDFFFTVVKCIIAKLH